MSKPYRFIIVTAADSAYYTLLEELLASLEDTVGATTIGLLDLGLTEAQRAALRPRVAAFAEPGWDIDFPARAKAPHWFRGFTARPFLPRYFPGYDVYLYIDCDTWVQDGSVIDLYLSVAWGGKLAVTPEIDRCYKSLYKWQRPRFNTIMFREYRQGYGWRVANQLGRNPVVNAGIFALRADAPHWDLYRDAMAQGLRSSWSALREQTALNYVVYHNRLPTGLLPAWCNWKCIDGPPMVDEASGLVVEPQPPHRPLGILHLSGPAKDLTFALETLQGRRIEAKLTYTRWRRATATAPAS